MKTIDPNTQPPRQPLSAPWGVQLLLLALALTLTAAWQLWPDGPAAEPVTDNSDAAYAVSAVGAP